MVRKEFQFRAVLAELARSTAESEYSESAYKLMGPSRTRRKEFLDDMAEYFGAAGLVYDRCVGGPGVVDEYDAVEARKEEMVAKAKRLKAAILADELAELVPGVPLVDAGDVNGDDVIGVGDAEGPSNPGDDE